MSAKHIAIIDYGMGNLHSVASALHRVAPEIKVSISAEPSEVEAADHIVFPGVGAIRDCMAEIRRHGFDEVVARVQASGKPLLAICVGMQCLMDRSEENKGVDCLGMISGKVKFFSDNIDFQHRAAQQHLKVPHMGWNEVAQEQNHPLWHNIPQNSRFYFVHSYYVELADPAHLAARSEYGIDFTAALAYQNVFAVQFHPEKSHRHGLQLLRNFVDWRGDV